MMPDQDLPRTTAESPSAPPVRPSIIPTRLSLHDLSTGGRWGPVTALPTALGRPLARLGEMIRTHGAAWRLGRGAGKSAH